MNAHTSKALLQDAFYQVLDNKVFRILVILSICLIAPTFLIAFKPTELDVLFGWQTFKYSELGVLGAGAAATKDAHIAAIQGLQDIFIEGLAGTFGIMLSLAATAFFVPRMLEKGEADILFSKPAGRFVLLFARYLSGIVFVGLLAFVLVLGMHIGFLVRSGYSDPAFLWSALTLVYVFALIHAFSTMVGVLSRSSITALLMSILFFGFNGCVHNVLWLNKEHAVTQIHERIEASDSAEAKETLEQMDAPLLQTLATAIDVTHYVLPKTGDAAFLVNNLRRAVSAPDFAFEDPVGELRFAKEPEGFVRSGWSGRTIDLSTTTATWTSVIDSSNISASRRTRVNDKTSSGAPKRARSSSTSAANELVKTLNSQPEIVKKAERARDPFDRLVRDLVTWSEKRGDTVVQRQRAFLGLGNWLFEFDFEYDDAWVARGGDVDALQEFVSGARPDGSSASSLDADKWYAKQFGWTSPLRYNAFFSILSSLAFALIMLLIARWKLSRIDF
ncbi:MAG: ABC transporter permease [Planctomycetota bacterium]|nr:ABC transporter permease [Planctomycetota bacterium]